MIVSGSMPAPMAQQGGPDRTLARTLAGLARGLRRDLQARLTRELAAGDGPVLRLHQAVERELTPQTPREFADAWAQTLVYLLLAGRWLAGFDVVAGIGRVDARLGGLVARLLALAEATALREAVAAVELPATGDDPVMHFYEKFLAAYDPRTRAARGVYFTPAPVVAYIVETTDAVLKDSFDLPLGLADASSWASVAAARGVAVPAGVDPTCPFVQVLDPAAGTGTFLIAVIRRAHATMTARWQAAGVDADGRRAAWSEYARTALLPRLRGVERMLAPWAIATLRLALLLAETGVVGELPPRVLILGDTLARTDLSAPISVVLGNPPYEREAPTGGGGGVVRGGAGSLLADFVEPARRAGAGGHVKNLYNLYVYFWRWACWQVFERRPQAPGVIAMVTASSFLRGPGFVGMRAHLRGQASKIFVLDLEGDGRGASVSDNVFGVTVPVAVTTLVRDGLSSGTGVWVHRAAGGRSEKLELCARTTALADLRWTAVPEGEAWGSADDDAFAGWPRLIDLFPWQHSGAQWKRTWPVATAPEVLTRRWQTLVAARERGALFHETRDRKIDGRSPPLRSAFLRLSEGPGEPIREAERQPPVRRYGFRALDRRWCLADARLGDFLRPILWAIAGARQVYLTSLLTGALGPGPAAMISAEVPDLHFFCGRGGKDVIPLWRDAEGTTANTGAGVLEVLRRAYTARPEDLLAYVYALLSAPTYTTRFAAALRGGGPRIPWIRDAGVWSEIAALGHRTIALHSFGARWLGEGPAPAPVHGEARCEVAPADMPTRVVHADARLMLYKGDVCVGAFAPVSLEVWTFALSGYRPVQAWVASRLAGGAGRRSSRLDAILCERWTSDTTSELLELLWTVEASLVLGPALDAALERACAGPCWAASELPLPAEHERRPPEISDEPAK